jgi:hypothetical protein
MPFIDLAVDNLYTCGMMNLTLDPFGESWTRNLLAAMSFATCCVIYATSRIEALRAGVNIGREPGGSCAISGARAPAEGQAAHRRTDSRNTPELDRYSADAGELSLRLIRWFESEPNGHIF